MATTGVVRRHFDLSHFNSELNDLRFHVGMAQFPVNRHDNASLAQAARDNAVIGMLTAPQRAARITHFADVPMEHFPERQIRRMKLTYDDGDRRFKLRSVAWYGTYIPPQYRHRHRTEALKSSPPGQPAKLRELGLRSVAQDTPASVVNLLADADLIGTTMDTAVELVGRHPQLGTTFAPSAARLEGHITAPNNHTALLQLSFYIKQNPNWQSKEQPKDPVTGNPYVFEYSLGSNNVGDPVEQYALSDDTLTKTGAALTAPLNSANNDTQLRNQSWSVLHGRPVNQGGAGAANRAARARARTEFAPRDANWTAATASMQSDWGLSIDPNSLYYDGTNVNISVTNHIQRTVCAYVEFLDPSGNTITPPNWTSKLKWTDGDLSSLETSTVKFLQPIGPQFVAMGIPISSTTDTVSFPWIEGASSANLIFGSMGGTNYQKPQSIPGAVLTGIFNFGFPALFLAAAVFSADGEWYAELLAGTNALLIIDAGAAIVAGLEFDDSTQVLKTFGGIVAGLMVKQGLQFVMEKVVAWIAGDEAAECIPIVGQVLRVGAMAGYTAQLTEAALEVFGAPAQMSIQIARSFTLNVGVTPDPRHGLPGRPDTAVWPALAATYEVTVQYRSGASWFQTGTMPRSETGTPLALTFDNMPAASTQLLHVVVAIKASNGWLCGTWTSDWQDAMPDGGSTWLQISGNITEQLAPLTQDTTYSWNQSIVYDPNKNGGKGGHVWAYDAAPTATAASLGTGTQVGLGNLVDLTILEIMYAAGYVWMGYPLNPNAGASGAPATVQAYCYQGLSLINDPDLQLVTPNSVTAEPSAVFYEKFGAPPKPGGPPPFNYFLDPSTGTLNLTYIDLSGTPPGPLTLYPPQPTWGTIPLLKTLDGVVVHPSGYVLGISSTTHKLLSLTLPKAGASAATGSAIAQISSNRGTRQGLIDTPVAMDISPDGRVLVLEQGNARVQAFDAHANPVPSFDDALLFTAPGAGITGALDQETLPPALQALFLSNGINQLFALPSNTSDIAGAMLKPGPASQALLHAFQDEGTLLSAKAVVAAGPDTGQWTITDPLTGQSYGVVGNAQTGFEVFHIFGADATVTARVAGGRWTISDPAGAAAYDIKTNLMDASKIDVYSFISTFPLHPTADGSPATCLDVAVEPTGYVYVLSHGGKGDHVSDYTLDIYTPEGAFLSRTGSNPGANTGFVGAKIAVDIWRNLFTLDYQNTVGPNGQSEPTISQWVPTPPVGTLDQSYSTAFANNDTGTVISAFQNAGIATAPAISITQVSAAGHWQVQGPPNYDVLLSAQTTQPIGSKPSPTVTQLYVYALTAA